MRQVHGRHVVNINGVLKDHDQPLAVKSDSEDSCMIVHANDLLLPLSVQNAKTSL